MPKKTVDGTKDPSLTKVGVERARYIAKMMQPISLAHIFSTEYKRTQQTAEPTANAKDLKIKSYKPGKLRGISTDNKKIIRQYFNCWAPVIPRQSS